MQRKHLAKHENDYEAGLQCHKRPRTRDVNFREYSLMSMSMKQVYAVLGIALNLIEDEIQLSDLVRFIYEGHIGAKNVYKYFPENIPNLKQILKDINFYNLPSVFSDKVSLKLWQ